MVTNSLFPKIENLLSQLKAEAIPDERKIILQPLIDYIQEKVEFKKEIRLNLICTHNSRRSHLSQVWAQTAAYFYSIPNVICYSGGTAVTALFPVVAETLKRQGFEIKTISESENPIYSIKFTDNQYPIIGFSKTFDDTFNPKNEFAAIMTCSQAEGDCPFILGAEKRIPVTYEDPKAFDNTSEQAAKYEERSLQIAAEMSYVFSQIKL